MTDPLSIGVAGAALAVAVAAAALHWPRPPALDGERWFKVMLSTLLRGEVEAAGGDADAWERAVLRFVPYHPAGRWPERKVANPRAFEPPAGALPGERALLESLASCSTAPDRWARLYDTDELAIAARLDDPADLGPAYDPATQLGRDTGWDALAAWGGGDDRFLRQARARHPAAWVWVDGRPGRASGPCLAPPLAEVLGELPRFGWADGPIDDRVAALGAWLRAALPEVESRLVVVAEEAGVALLLRALEGAADLRDRVDAVLSIGGAIGGRPGEEGPFGTRDAEDWLAVNFTQGHLDTEVVKLTPYLAVQWLDRSDPALGAGGLPLASARFPVPVDDVHLITAESVDLGPLPVDRALPLTQVARALFALTTCWVLSRRA